MEGDSTWLQGFSCSYPGRPGHRYGVRSKDDADWPRLHTGHHRQAPIECGPCRVVGYPWVPAVLVPMTGLVLNTLYERPLQSLLGVGLVALDVPVFR